MIQSPVAASKDALRASENDPVHSRSITRAPNDFAISIVRSVEPVSTITISSTAGAAAARQRGSISSSSRTIMHRLSFRPLAGWALDGDALGSGGERGKRGVERPLGPSARELTRAALARGEVATHVGKLGIEPLRGPNSARAASMLHSS